MRANAVGTRENIIVIDKAEFGGMTVEVLEYQKLLGTTNINSAVDMYYICLLYTSRWKIIWNCKGICGRF